MAFVQISAAVEGYPSAVHHTMAENRMEAVVPGSDTCCCKRVPHVVVEHMHSSAALHRRTGRQTVLGLGPVLGCVYCSLQTAFAVAFLGQGFCVSFWIEGSWGERRVG